MIYVKYKINQIVVFVSFIKQIILYTPLLDLTISLSLRNLFTSGAIGGSFKVFPMLLDSVIVKIFHSIISCYQFSYLRTPI